MPESRLQKFGQALGGGALVILVPVIIVFLIALSLRGVVWISNKAILWLDIATGITFLVVTLILLPMCAFRKTRGLGGVGCVYASYVFGLELWAYSCLFVVYTWGYVALFVGLFFFAVGVVPMAILASLFHREWSVLWELIFSIVLTFGTRAFGLWIVSKSDRAARGADEAVLVDY